MDAFNRLSPALQYQIVNDLGWKALRPVQEETIDAVLDGHNCVVLAPTAGGKTEAAFFPLLSIMDSEDLQGTSVVYISPIRALLNNQEARLDRLTGLLGRRAMKWHGDVGASKRRRFIREPADVLAITPESIEAMLISSQTPGKALLSKIRAVVIDEVHAFAADDRGSHLVALLERLKRLSGYDIQRIGLSATVGDPEVICDWLSGSSTRRRVVVNPGGGGTQTRLALDFVGNLANASVVIDRLYPGTKRLVFVDSRRRVEELGDHLQQRGANIFVSHSSLAAGERCAAEEAFEEAENCVIVATSALELGIDVGDLDHVLQIDAPSSVSSFLQRMGRTGRRPGAVPNCTFLATSEQAILQTAGLLRLYSQGFIEPTEPSRSAPHILAHQLLTLGLQQHGVASADWWSWLDGCAAFADLSVETRRRIHDHMLAEGILVETDSRLILGEKGERLYGPRNFFELFAVFSVSPVLKVLHGNREVGTIDAWFARQRNEGPLCFVLANRPWKVVTINWKTATCIVEPAEKGTYPRWMGGSVLLSQTLCRAMREILVDDKMDDAWSRRACEVIGTLRETYAFMRDKTMPLVPDNKRVRWWTFGGGRANSLLATLLQAKLGERVTADNLAVSFSKGAAESDSAIRTAIRDLREQEAISFETAKKWLPESATAGLSKFQPCLPSEIERDLAARKLLDVEGALTVIGDMG